MGRDKKAFLEVHERSQGLRLQEPSHPVCSLFELLTERGCCSNFQQTPLSVHSQPLHMPFHCKRCSLCLQQQRVADHAQRHHSCTQERDASLQPSVAGPLHTGTLGKVQARNGEEGGGGVEPEAGVVQGVQQFQILGAAVSDEAAWRCWKGGRGPGGWVSSVMSLRMWSWLLGGTQGSGCVWDEGWRVRGGCVSSLRMRLCLQGCTWEGSIGKRPGWEGERGRVRADG